MNMFLSTRHTYARLGTGLLLLGAILLVLCIPRSAHAAPLQPHAGTPNGNQIVNNNSNLCLGVQNASLTNGSRVVQWGCNANADQQWHIEKPTVYTNVYRIRNDKNQCLALYQGQAGVWTCNGNLDQDWYQSGYQGSFQTSIYENVISLQCLGVLGGSKKGGAQVIVWTCNGNSDQAWVWAPNLGG